MGVMGFDILYAVRDVILVQRACPTTRYGDLAVCATAHGGSDVTR